MLKHTRERERGDPSSSLWASLSISKLTQRPRYLKDLSDLTQGTLALFIKALVRI